MVKITVTFRRLWSTTFSFDYLSHSWIWKLEFLVQFICCASHEATQKRLSKGFDKDVQGLKPTSIHNIFALPFFLSFTVALKICNAIQPLSPNRTHDTHAVIRNTLQVWVCGEMCSRRYHLNDAFWYSTSVPFWLRDPSNAIEHDHWAINRSQCAWPKPWTLSTNLSVTYDVV